MGQFNVYNITLGQECSNIDYAHLLVPSFLIEILKRASQVEHEVSETYIMVSGKVKLMETNYIKSIFNCKKDFEDCKRNRYVDYGNDTRRNFIRKHKGSYTIGN